MGSQYIDLHLVDPALVQARLRGDIPDLVDTLYRAAEPPHDALRPAFAVMARGTFVFLRKGARHPEGAEYGRAVEYLLQTLGQKKWCLEYYPDEGEYPLWELSFGKCDANWLDVPGSDSGIPALAWRSPETCSSLAYSISRNLADRSFNPRYSPERTLQEAQLALQEGSSSGLGIFTVFQG
jgi:hypothetical protein